MGKLSALKVKSLKEQGRYQDGDGLMLDVKSNGKRYWLLRIQVDGKRREFGLGSADKVSLADARSNAREVRSQYQSGIDPVAAKKAARTKSNGIPTFEEASIAVHAENAPGWRNHKHAAQWLSTLERYAYPSIGEKPVNEVEGPEIRDLLADIWLAKPETARRVRQRIGTVLDWAHAKGYRETEAPMRSISKGLPRQPKKDNHFAAMAYPALPAFVRQLSETDTMGRLALRFTILTAARSGEVRGATWEEIDQEQGLWTVPAERMKAGREHVVPLSDEALQVLSVAQQMRSGLTNAPIFHGLRGRALSDMTMTKVLRDMTYPKITVHGFRSTFRDWAAEQTDTAGDVVESALAHTVRNRVEAAYRRTNYLEKRWPLMKEWARYCMSE